MNTTLRIGRIPFLVCAPFFHRFLDQNEPGFEFVDDPPRMQNRALRAGKIHLSPSSSLEYAQNSGQYLVAPDICTSSTLEIRSVKLFSHKPWEYLGGEPVHLSGQSDTSVALVRVLSALRYGVDPVFDDTGAFDASRHVARALIGDEALREDVYGNWPFRYDLATVWQAWKGLPFVFGMWIIHQNATSPELQPLLNRFLSEMALSVEEFRKDRATVLKKWWERYPAAIPWETALSYHDAVDYRFTPDRQQSLALFYQDCVTIGILAEAPELRFWKGL